MILNVFLVIVGVVFLIKGADFLVSGAGSLARSYGVSPLFIGLTVVAFGTSAPELAVSLSATVKGFGGIAISNVVGSNIANVALVVGLSAIFIPIRFARSTLVKEIPFNILVGIVLMILLLHGTTISIGQLGGIVLLTLFVVFMVYTIRMAKKDRQAFLKVPQARSKEQSRWKGLLFTLIGLGGVVAGGDLTVTNATEIARAVGISETLIGLTMVAIGTSLPELVTSVVAALKKESDMAIGNIIGSNLFNILMVLGFSASIKPMSMTVDHYGIDLSYMVGLTVFLLIAGFFGRRVLGRWSGIGLLVSYGIYVCFIAQRG